MKQPTKISTGSARIPVPTFLFMDRVKTRYDVTVSVPAAIAGSRFMFDIRRFLIQAGADSSVQVGVIKNIAELILKYQAIMGTTILGSNPKEDFFSTEGIQESPALRYLKSVFDDETVRRLLKEANEGIQRSVVRGSLADSLLLSSLLDENAIIASLGLGSFPLTMSTIESAINMMQTVNNQILTAKDLSAISSTLQGVLGDEFFSCVSALKSVFQERKSPSLIVLRSDVEAQMMPLFGFDDPDWRSELHVNGLVERVTDIDRSLEGVPRLAYLVTYFKVVRTWMGVPMSVPFAEDDIFRVIRLQMAGQIDLPSLPKDFSNDALFKHPLKQSHIDAVQTFFLKEVARNIIRSLATGDSGFLKGKLLSLLDSRAYKKADIYNFLVDRTFDLLSIVHNAVSSALRTLASIALSTLAFPYEKPWRDGLLIDYFKRSLAVWSTHRLPTDNLREIMEPANIVGSEPIREIAMDIPSFFYDDTVAGNFSALEYDRINDVYSRYFVRRSPLQGSLFDIPAPIPPAVMVRNQDAFSEKLPLYVIQTDLHAPAVDTVYGSLLVRSLDIEELSSIKMLRYIEQFSSFTFYTNPEDFASAWNITLAEAYQLFDKRVAGTGPDPLAFGKYAPFVYLRYNAPLKRSVVWSPMIAPVFEYGPEPTYDYLEPFCDYYPAATFVAEDGFMRDDDLHRLLLENTIRPSSGTPLNAGSPLTDQRKEQEQSEEVGDLASQVDQQEQGGSEPNLAAPDDSNNQDLAVPNQPQPSRSRRTPKKNRSVPNPERSGEVLPE